MSEPTFDAACVCDNPAACEVKGWNSLERDGQSFSSRCKTFTAYAEQAALESSLASTRISKRFRTRTFESFQPSQDSRHALEVCKRWVSKFPHASGIGLILHGPVGTGKTHLVSAIVNALHTRKERVLFACVPDLVADFRAAIKDGRSDAIIDEVIAAPVLVLDDLGAERATEYVQEVIPRIINRRYEDLAPTIITTNLSLPELETQITARSTSRLVEMCHWLELAGPDYRRTSKQRAA